MSEQKDDGVLLWMFETAIVLECRGDGTDMTVDKLRRLTRMPDDVYATNIKIRNNSDGFFDIYFSVYGDDSIVKDWISQIPADPASAKDAGYGLLALPLSREIPRGEGASETRPKRLKLKG
jgi:hypothetical protein